MQLSYYKNLYRRVARLPLDHRSLEITRQKLRSHFTNSKNVPTYSVVNRKLYDRVVSVLDGILIDEQYKKFDKLLDLIYLDLEPRAEWVDQFYHTRYGAFKTSWPQVHLIDEFGDAKSRRNYHEVLARMQPTTDFSFVKAMKIPRDAEFGNLKPLQHSPKSEPGVFSPSELFGQVRIFHSFLNSQAKVLSDTQIHMLDVCYKPNRYGLPPSIATMEAELKLKVNYAKLLLEKFRPIGKENLMYLIEFVTSKDQSGPKINPGFFRYMLRKRNKEEGLLSPAVSNIW
ncbi:hypothetical protein JCM33374_g5540 [Metschnikowia sp. JCM 33374]|nr:hypothetical protein JCM33374_g5540 [Metschnikowia sp. JCM 33374]